MYFQILVNLFSNSGQPLFHEQFTQSIFRFWSIYFQILVNLFSDFGQCIFRFWSIYFQILVDLISDSGQFNFRFWSIQGLPGGPPGFPEPPRLLRALARPWQALEALRGPERCCKALGQFSSGGMPEACCHVSKVLLMSLFSETPWC